MIRLTLVTVLLFFLLTSNGQTVNKKPAPSKAVTLEFITLSFGDLPHYMFKDVASGKEMDVEFDNNETDYKVAKDEIDNTCDYEGNCKMTGVTYKATFQEKLVYIYDWNGEESVKTGKKEKRWILTKLSKATAN